MEIGVWIYSCIKCISSVNGKELSIIGEGCSVRLFDCSGSNYCQIAFYGTCPVSKSTGTQTQRNLTVLRMGATMGNKWDIFRKVSTVRCHYDCRKTFSENLFFLLRGNIHLSWQLSIKQRVHPTPNPPAPNPSKQAKITNAMSVGGNRRGSQGKIDKLALRFICEGLHPFSFVKRPAFKDLVMTVSQGHF